MAGRPSWSGCWATASGRFPRSAQSRNDVTAALDETFQLLLAKSPEDRPQTMAAVITELERCRKSGKGKGSRPLMVFDDRDEETRRRDSTYKIATTKRDSSPRKSEPLSSVFVRSRAPSNDEQASSGGSELRELWQLIITFVIIAIGLIAGWFLIK